jgi:hypothetical protein
MSHLVLTDEQYAAARSLGRLRAKAFGSDFAKNVLGFCGEIAFKQWATSRADCDPVRVAYWYPSLTGTADVYIGPQLLAVDVKAHRAAGDILYPRDQARRSASTGIEAAVWARIGPSHGEVEWDTALVRPVEVALVGWSTIQDVAYSPVRTLLNADIVHVVDPAKVYPIDDLPALHRSRAR